MSSRLESPVSARRKVAVALRYQPPGDTAPAVVAGGYGTMADRILDLAREALVPVHQDAELADALGQLGVDRPIPPELYQAVAEVISFVYSLRPGARA